MAPDGWTNLSKPAPLPKGTRIRLLSMTDDPDPIAPGTEGTVIGGNGEQLWVRWENGRSLNVLVGIDRYQVIGDA